MKARKPHGAPAEGVDLLRHPNPRKRAEIIHRYIGIPVNLTISPTGGWSDSHYVEGVVTAVRLAQGCWVAHVTDRAGRPFTVLLTRVIMIQIMIR